MTQIKNTGRPEREEHVGWEPPRRDAELSISRGQTEGKAVSSVLISADPLTPQYPPCCAFTAAPAGQQNEAASPADGWPTPQELAALELLAN